MLTHQLSSTNTACVAQDASDSIKFLLPLSESYPEIEHWFKAKVIPGLYNETRKLFIKRRNGRIAALAIAKKTQSERKICTVRVAPEYIGKGLGDLT